MTHGNLNKTLQQQAVALCCKHREAVPEDVSGAYLKCQAVSLIATSLSSRRTRLWELPIELHCSIVGVCFSIEALRRLVVKHYKAPCIVDDYEIHSVVVQACSSRTPLIELLQRELDRCFQQQIKQFQSAKSGQSVVALWRSAISGEDETASLAGSLWASLTHPRANRALMTQIGHDIHMIQHRMGTETRRDTQALTQARKLNAQCVAELEAARVKLLEMQQQHSQEAAAHRQQVVETDAALVGVQAQNDALRLQLEALRLSVEKLDSREKLTQRLNDLAEQNIRLKQQVAASLERRAVALARPADPMSLGMTVDSTKPEPRAINLDNKSVLCVGGRSSAVVLYRKAVERAGGKFLHHDGGIEHNHHRLDANLAAADCVVCQTACISHTAYWQVKDYCKKTGKQCVYLDKPSMSSFVEGLSTLPGVPEELRAVHTPCTHAPAQIQA